MNELVEGWMDDGWVDGWMMDGWTDDDIQHRQAHNTRSPITFQDFGASRLSYT